MENIEELVKKVNKINNIDLNDIPDIDLYMDQVIQLFDNKLEGLKRKEDDKILTKTMINNYVKGKLLMPVKKKKYSKEHILLVSLIYELKGILSINDIQKLLEPMVEDIENDRNNLDLEGVYNNINNIRVKQVDEFEEEIINYSKELDSMEFKDEYEKNLALSVVLATKANLYRRLSEEIVERLNK